MADNRKKSRKAYLDDFKKMKEGQYEYTGELYSWQEDEDKKRKKKLTLWTLSILLLASAVAACCVPAPGAVNCAYVLIPCAGVFLAGISVCYGMYRFSTGGHPLRAYIYRASVQQIPVRAVCAAVCAGASVAGELIYVLRNSLEGKTVGFILLLILEGAALLMSLEIVRIVHKMSWFIEGKESDPGSD